MESQSEAGRRKNSLESIEKIKKIFQQTPIKNASAENMQIPENKKDENLNEIDKNELEEHLSCEISEDINDLNQTNKDSSHKEAKSSINKIFQTTVIEKSKKAINFKVIKNREKNTLNINTNSNINCNNNNYISNNNNFQPSNLTREDTSPLLSQNSNANGNPFASSRNINNINNINNNINASNNSNSLNLNNLKNNLVNNYTSINNNQQNNFNNLIAHNPHYNSNSNHQNPENYTSTGYINCDNKIINQNPNSANSQNALSKPNKPSSCPNSLINSATCSNELNSFIESNNNNSNNNNLNNLNNLINQNNMKNSKAQMGNGKQPIFEMNSTGNQTSVNYNIKNSNNTSNLNSSPINSEMPMYTNMNNININSCNNTAEEYYNRANNALNQRKIPMNAFPYMDPSQNYSFYEKENFSGPNGVNFNRNLNTFISVNENYQKKTNKENEENQAMNNIYINPANFPNAIATASGHHGFYTGAMPQNFAMPYNPHFNSYGIPNQNFGFPANYSQIHYPTAASPRRKPLKCKDNYIEELLSKLEFFIFYFLLLFLEIFFI